MMRIGLVSPPWVPVPPPAYGGIEIVVDRLARGLVSAGHDVLLAAPANSTCPVPRVPGLAEVHPGAGITGDGITELNHVIKAYAAMAELNVIHDHTVCGPLYRHRPAGVPVVTTNHGPFVPMVNGLYKQMSDDTAVVAISKNQAAAADGVQIRAVIHHGLDVHRVPVGSGDGGFAVCLGRMNPTKGIREAIMIARDAEIPLRIAAKMREEAEHDYFDAQIAPLLSDEIEYVGELDEPAKFELLGQAFALLNPIQWPEPFGLVMIESLACGTPVVTTSAGSVPEIIDDGITGFIRDDLRDLADMLPKVAKLDRGECRRVAQDRFSVSRMVADHLKLYAELIEEGRRTPPGRVPAW
jgi:glycosyltransferase involved in cell wall biosynthesis